MQTKHEYESREIRRQRLNREREATVLPDEDDNNQSDSDNSDNDNGNENDNVQYSNRSTSVNGGSALTKMTSKSVTIDGRNQTDAQVFPLLNMLIVKIPMKGHRVFKGIVVHVGSN